RGRVRCGARTPGGAPLVMRVLHVDTGRTWRGGQEQVLALTTGLAEQGVHATLAARPGSALGARARAAGVPVADVVMRGDHDPLASFRLLMLARRARVDVLHAHTAHAHSLLLPVSAV